MDKKVLLSGNLAKTLKKYLDQIHRLIKSYSHLTVVNKTDGSPVTPLDLALSGFFEELAYREFPDVTFYSEEKFFELTPPLLILDPLDGTREYIEGRADWSISVALVESGQLIGEGWIYHPASETVYGTPAPRQLSHKDHFCGEVSRTEWKHFGLEAFDHPTFKLRPVGSIAYKLARLSAGESDFVISLRPKNVWDIAAGTILTQAAGMRFYSAGAAVNELQQTYHPPLIWCYEEQFSELSQLCREMDRGH